MGAQPSRILHNAMNNSLNRAALLAAAFLAPVPCIAAEADATARDGIIFRNQPCTLLIVKASSMKNGEEGVFDHTIVLRFHRNAEKSLDIKVLPPGESKIEWGIYDDWSNYTGNGHSYASSEHDQCHNLELRVQSFGKSALNSQGKPECRIVLDDSSYTNISAGQKWIDTYTFAREATLVGAAVE